MDNESGYNRPRRPNPETIAYLRGLPLDIDTSKSELDSFVLNGKKDEDFPQSLAAALSAIDEIRMEIASLAGDELGSQCIETLSRIAVPVSESAARILLSACEGYHLHLATHRYGSHVIQTILQLGSYSSIDADLGLHSEASQFGSYVDTLPSFSDLVDGMVNELRSSVTDLSVHICGSHVLRTLFCVIGGLEMIPSGPGGGNRFDSGALLRGRKKAKKKKKKVPTDTAVSAPHAGSMQVVYRENSRLKIEHFRSQLEAMAYALAGDPIDAPGELQQLACHPSAGPLIIILLRVLTYSTDEAKSMMQNESYDTNSQIADFRLGVTRQEPTFEIGSVAHTVVKRLLCWNDKEEAQKQVGDVIYGLSGEARGSHIVETLFRLSPDEVYDEIIQYGDFDNPKALQDYCEHDVSNFVVQTLLTTIRSSEQAEKMLKAIEKVVSGGLAVDPIRRRRGILWRTCELAAKYRVGQESLLKSIRIGFGTLNVAEESSSAPPSADAKKKKQRKKASALEIKDCIPMLIGFKKPLQDGARVEIDAAGVRTVYQLLHFSPRLCEQTIRGIFDGLSTEEIEHLAKDGLGSRCILDGILEGPSNTPAFSSAFKELFLKLEGRWTSLSTDRVGHHTVKRLFHALPKMDDKAKLVEELVAGGNRLNGNVMGRNVSETCLVDLYREDRKEWRKAMTKPQTKEEAFVQDIIPKSEQATGGEKTKRKRKRKRPERGDKESPTSATDAIFNALTVPTKS